MGSVQEKIKIVAADPVTRADLHDLIHASGYDASAYATAAEALASVHQSGADLLLLDANFPDSASPSLHEVISMLRDSAVTEHMKIMLLVGPRPEDRASGLDRGVDDVLSRPWDSAELLARLRAQLRAQRREKELLAKMRIAEEGQQIAHTAFEALAVTEKMADDATSLNRRLKLGLIAVFVITLVMATIYFFFVRTARKETQTNTATINRLERRLLTQANLMVEARKLRARPAEADIPPNPKDSLQQQAAELKSKLALAETNAKSDELAELQTELAATNARLRQIEKQGDSAQGIISSDVQSVCLLHVSVAFRSQQNNQRLRYAGLNSQGEPLVDSSGNPVFTTSGDGPEVKMDVFGTGFLASSDGRVVTNRHVAEPWWKDEDLTAVTSQGFQAEISAIRAYFPGDPRAFHAEIQDISQDADLASMAVNMRDLKRPSLSVDLGEKAAVSGEPIVLMGYATGIAGILARTDEDTAAQILTRSGGDISQVMDELARRNLIRPIITQGHIGDVLPDKIVFDAQTTSGGSGGPLFNQQGKVIGITYAVLQGFGGSNFGIPIRLSRPLLSGHVAP